MEHDFLPGDFLIFQLESGYGLMRVLGSEPVEGDQIWHLSVYRDLYLDVDTAEAAAQYPEVLTVDLPHIALTTRAFESTQVARLSNSPLRESDVKALQTWKDDPEHETSDRSVRLMMGLR